MDAQLLDFAAGVFRLRGDDAEILRRRRLWDRRCEIAMRRQRLEAERRARGEPIPGEPMRLDRAAFLAEQAPPDGAA